MSEAFPPEWDKPEDKIKVINLLIAIKISPRHAKMALYEWCRVHDVELRAEDVVRVTGLPAGEI